MDEPMEEQHFFPTVDELARLMKRFSRLKKLEMSDLHAMELCVTLLIRDRPVSGDDRKLCIECKNWKDKCTKPLAGYCSVPTILQRCDGFTPIVFNMKKKVKK
jgi:hypothetical protein